MTIEAKKYLDEAAEARRLNVCPRTLQRWRVSAGLPYIKAGDRRVIYDPIKTDEWLAARMVINQAAVA